jgi:hypothetical protein
VLETEWFDGDSNYLYIDWASLPGYLFNVNVNKDVFTQAELSASIVNTKDKDLKTIISKEQSSVAFLLSPQFTNARLKFTLNDPQKEEDPIMLDLPTRSIRLDLNTFSQYGPQSVEVQVQLGTKLSEVSIDFKQEYGDDSISSLHFSKETLLQTYNYNSLHLFKNKYQYRLSINGQKQNWSSLIKPEKELKINLNHYE